MKGPVNAQPCVTDPSYCRLGCEITLKQLDDFENQIDGVLKSSDIEYVHRMRVGSRRIRAALTLFRVCFPKKDYKKWQREIKEVTHLLSNARDLDVQIVFIGQYKKDLKPTIGKTGHDLLLRHPKGKRKIVQSSVVNGLEKYVYLEKKTLKNYQMRIRAKKLRYTMEHFSPLHPNRLAGEIERMKAFQDVLGEIHECDVWIDYTLKFIDEAKNKTQPRKNKKVDFAKVDTIISLAGLLRVADSLDYVHQSNVKTLNFKINTKKITVECLCETESILEEQAFNKKKNLFERVLAKKLVLSWKTQRKTPNV